MFFGDNTRLPNDTANMYNWSYKAVDMVGIITSLEQEKSGLFTNQRFFFPTQCRENIWNICFSTKRD